MISYSEFNLLRTRIQQAEAAIAQVKESAEMAKTSAESLSTQASKQLQSVAEDIGFINRRLAKLERVIEGLTPPPDHTRPPGAP